MTAVNGKASGNVLETNILVSINGLQSEVGKPLNGGLGIIIRKLNKEGRYPVRIFALRDASGGYKVTETVQDKNLKTINVSNIDTEDAMEAFKEANEKHLKEAEASNDRKSVLFWLATSYKLMPEAYYYTISYANALSIAEGKHKEAATIMHKVLQEQDITFDPRFPTFYEQIVKTCCDGKVYLDMALKCALAIPTDTPENTKISYDCLETFVNTCKPIIGKKRGLGVEELAQWNVQAAEKLLEHDPDNALLLEVVAGSYCLAGDNLQGAKLYRKAIVKGAPVSKIQKPLILAQMQCPGMPLDGDKFFHVYTNQETFYYVHNSEKGNLHMEERNGMINVYPKPGTQLHMLNCQMDPGKPEDHNDPDVFPADLLDQLNSAS